MYTREENLVFQNYLQKLIERPLKIQAQPHKRDGRFLWCEDWELIEILKCLFNGCDYMGDPPPNRLKNNPMFSKQFIVDQTDRLIALYKTPEAIVEHLKERRSNYGQT